MKRFALTLVGAVHLVLLDAVAKEAAAFLLKGKAAFCVIPGFFNLAYVENRGCAWGMFQGTVWPLALFGAAAFAFAVWKRRELFGGSAAAECLLYAGIAGNLIDRVARGFVIDFIDLHLADAWHFPCFNIADVCITFAAALLVLSSFRKPERR